MINRNRMLVVSAVVLCVGACADILQITDVPDGAIASDSSTPDVSVPVPCDPATPFSSMTPVNGLETVGVVAVRLSPDLLTAYVCKATTNPNGPISLAVATRGTLSSPFGSENVVANNMGICELSTTLDNLTAVWTRADVPDGSATGPPAHLYLGKRGNALDPFDFNAGTLLSGLASAGSLELYPFLIANGSELYYNGSQSNNYKYTWERAYADAGYQVGTLVAGLPSYPGAIVVTSDDLVACFFDAPTPTTGGIYCASRADATDSFGNTKRVSPFPDSGADNGYNPVMLTDDRCTLYLSTTQQVKNINDQTYDFVTTLYQATRSP